MKTWLIIAARGVLPEKLGGDVRPTSQYPYPIYDQNLRYSLPGAQGSSPFTIYDLTKNSKPYLWPEPYTNILFQTSVITGSLVQTNVKLP